MMGITCANIQKSYNGKSVLKDISLEIQPGELHTVVGPSGCGKTTLLRILSLLEAPDTGTISLDGTEYRHLPIARPRAWEENNPYRLRVSLVFQQLFLWPHIRLLDAIELTERSETWRRYVEPLDMSDAIVRYPNEVSLGQKQRAAFLRALATDAEYYFFDEITSALDNAAAETVFGILEELRCQGKSIILVTHTPEKLINDGYIEHKMYEGGLK